MPVTHPRLSAALAIAIVAIPAGGDALAHPSADVTPTRASLNASALLLHTERRARARDLRLLLGTALPVGERGA